MNENVSNAYQGFAIVELMGHRKIAGKVSEVEQFGAKMLRVDVPEVEGHEAYTQFYGGTAIYCVTPTDETTAKKAAESFRAAPISPLIMLPRIAQDDYEDYDDYEADLPY